MASLPAARLALDRQKQRRAATTARGAYSVDSKFLVFLHALHALERDQAWLVGDATDLYFWGLFLSKYPASASHELWVRWARQSSPAFDDRDGFRTAHGRAGAKPVHV